MIVALAAAIAISLPLHICTTRSDRDDGRGLARDGMRGDLAGSGKRCGDEGVWAGGVSVKRVWWWVERGEGVFGAWG